MNGLVPQLSAVALATAFFFAPAAPASATLLGDEVDLTMIGLSDFTDTVTVTHEREIQDFGGAGDIPSPCNVCNGVLVPGEWVDIAAASIVFHFVEAIGTSFSLTGLDWQDFPGGSIIDVAVRGTLAFDAQISPIDFTPDSVFGQINCFGACDVLVELTVDHGVGVPEPMSAGLMGLGLTSLAALRRRRKRT